MSTSLPFPINPPPTAITCENAGQAVEIVRHAQSLCLNASYHPIGGQTAKQNIPITHTVYVMGKQANIDILLWEITK